MCPLLAPWLQHVPLPLLTAYSISTLSKDSAPMQGVYWLIYPYSRWGYSYWLRYNERRYREMYSEVTPYTITYHCFLQLSVNLYLVNVIYCMAVTSFCQKWGRGPKFQPFPKGEGAQSPKIGPFLWKMTQIISVLLYIVRTLSQIRRGPGPQGPSPIYGPGLFCVGCLSLIMNSYKIFTEIVVTLDRLVRRT